MKQIGTTETGVLVEMTNDEYQSANNPLIGKVLAFIASLALQPLQTPVIQSAPVSRGPKEGAKREYKPREKKSIIMQAVEIMKENGRPMTLEAVVDRLKFNGVKFKTSTPAFSLRASLVKGNTAIMVGREGHQGLWTVPGSRTESSLSSKEKILVDADPKELTADARETRKALLIQLDRKLRD